MSADEIISRLSKVKKTGPRSWVACCPAHNDRSPSMTIRETDDGRVLIHDFAGCDPLSILQAIGLSFESLFPVESRWEHSKGERVPFNPRDVLRALSHEVFIVALASCGLAKGKALPEIDHQRLLLAVSRIHTATEACQA